MISNFRDAMTLDPAAGVDSFSDNVMDCIFEGLVRFKPDSTEIQPWLADRWVVSGDGKRWTFHLRKNILFQDGTPLDALAVKISFERQLAPHHPFYPGRNQPNADFALGMIRSIRILGSNEVQFLLKYPYAPFLANLAMDASTPIVSPAALKKYGKDFWEHPVGTGPFSFEEWDKGKQIKLHAFPDYWNKDEPARISQVVFKVEQDRAGVMKQILQGKIDIDLSCLLMPQAAEVEKSGKARIEFQTGLELEYLGFNVSRKPFSDRQVREAVAMAINRRKLLKLYINSYSIAKSFLPPLMFGYMPDLPQIRPDLPKAIRMLKAAGHGHGLRLTLLWSRALIPEKIPPAIQRDLARVGIVARLRELPPEEMYRQMRDGHANLFLSNWTSDNGDPDNFLYPLFHSSQVARMNAFHYKNPEIDRLLQEGRQTGAPDERKKCYARIQRVLMQDLPCFPLEAGMEYAVVGEQVFGFKLNPSGHLYLNGVYKL